VSESSGTVREVETIHGKVTFVGSSQLPPAWTCQRCGGAVLDYMKHARWHEAVVDALLGAGSPWGPGQALGRV